MAERGPIPKRSTQRRRRNKTTEPTKAPATPKKPTAPRADPKWHPVAKRWYAALGKSGQSEFYEPSDWALACLLAESMSRDLKPQVVGINEETNEPVFAVIPLKGASLAAYLKAMTGLLVTEGDRRRASVELQRAKPAPPADGVPNLNEYRRRSAG
jgi:hypothetical protein